MSDARRVDVEITMNIPLPAESPSGNISMYRVYVGTTPLTNVQDTSQGNVELPVS